MERRPITRSGEPAKIFSALMAGSDLGCLRRLPTLTRTGVVEDPLCSGFHFAEMLNAGGVGDSVPDGFLVAEKVVEGVDIGLGLEEEAGHGDDGKAGNGGQGMEKKGTSQQRFSSPRSLALSPRTVPSPCPLAQSRIQD